MIDPLDDFAWLPIVLGREPQEVDRIQVVGIEGEASSMIRWGGSPPEVVYLHGGGQNAHTWDLVANLVGLPAVAIDLPGHGHSPWRGDRDYSPASTGPQLAEVIERLLEQPIHLVGMSLGGLNAIVLSHLRPNIVRSLTLVDVLPDALATPPLDERQLGSMALIDGPRAYASLEEMVAATVATAPHRPVDITRRGVQHNARELDDGCWMWRYDDLRGARFSRTEIDDLWTGIAGLQVASELILGAESPVVGLAALDRFRAERPDARVVTVPGAGHSIQSDQPAALANIIRNFIEM